jgi:hypothetical protein
MVLPGQLRIEPSRPAGCDAVGSVAVLAVAGCRKAFNRPLNWELADSRRPSCARPVTASPMPAITSVINTVHR